MDRNSDDDDDGNALQNAPFNGEAPLLSSNLFMDQVGEVVLTLNSDGLSWNSLDSPENVIFFSLSLSPPPPPQHFKFTELLVMLNSYVLFFFFWVTISCNRRNFYWMIMQIAMCHFVYRVIAIWRSSWGVAKFDLLTLLFRKLIIQGYSCFYETGWGFLFRH